MTTNEQFVNKNFFIYASGIFIFYFYHGIFQEKVSRTEYGPKHETFTYSMSLVFCQCLVNTFFGVLFNMVVDQKHSAASKDSTSNSLYFCDAFFYLTAMVSANMSLQYVSYPTQVIAKSCKPIPVMIVGVLCARKSYSARKYCFVLLIVVGVAIFLYNPSNFADRNQRQAGQSNISIDRGELLLLLSLAMDGFTGAFQDLMKSEHQTGPSQMMLWINCWAVVILLVSLLVTGEIFEFLHFVHRFPFVISLIAQISVASAIGQLFIFLSISAFSSLVCSLITTSRKFFTVLFSILFFGNSLTGQQWLGTLLVFVGLGLDMIYGRQSIAQQQQRPSGYSLYPLVNTSPAGPGHAKISHDV